MSILVVEEECLIPHLHKTPPSLNAALTFMMMIRMLMVGIMMVWNQVARSLGFGFGLGCEGVGLGWVYDL